MRIEEILKKNCIINNLVADSKENALWQMAEKLYHLGYVKKTFIQAIQDREAKYPSGLPMKGHKIAIPHTDAKYVNASVICFAKLKSPVTFSIMGDPSQSIQVQMISMFALKEKKEIGNLLEILITSYQDNDMLTSLLDAQDEQEMYSILHKSIGKYIKV